VSFVSGAWRHPIGVIFSQGRESAPPTCRRRATQQSCGLAKRFRLTSPHGRSMAIGTNMTRTFAIRIRVARAPARLRSGARGFRARRREISRSGSEPRRIRIRLCAFFEAPESPDDRQHLSAGGGLYPRPRPWDRPGSPRAVLVFGTAPAVTMWLVPGVVFTLEPGLYYASKGYGVRLEDVYALHAGGRFRMPAPFPKELLIPIER